MTLIRPCAWCTQTDDHPRDLVEIGGGLIAPWHMDCHVKATGCPACKRQLADAAGAKGDELRVHLVSLPPLVLDEHGQEVS